MIEWCASSYFSFLEGVSAPSQLISDAAEAGYLGLGLGDRMGQYGLVDALRARDLSENTQNFFFAPGIRLHFDIADPLFIYPLHKVAHARLCRFLSEWALEGLKVHEKGLSPIPWSHFKNFLKEEKNKNSLKNSFILISVSGRFYPWVAAPEKKSSELSRVQAQEARAPTPSFANPPTLPGFCPLWLLELVQLCGRGKDSALSLAYPLTSSPGLEDLSQWLEEESLKLQIPLVATTLPLFGNKKDQDLADLMTAIRHTCTVKNLGYLRQANGERSFLSKADREFFSKKLSQKFRDGKIFNDPIIHSVELSLRQHFSLSELHYQYPKESVPSDHTPTSYLRTLAFEGAAKRYPEGISIAVRSQMEHELSLIAELQYEDYFLTIWDILRYARSQNILFQGRGSAANSLVCFCLGITAIDPVRMNLLFERFLSVERHEPPDIDVDFEHERREEVMQEVYKRYGRDRAAMVATYICFRTRMAVRETSKALGISTEAIDKITAFLGREGLKNLSTSEENKIHEKNLESFFNKHKISQGTWKKLLQLVPRLKGIPRHVGLHTGGFILSSEPLLEQCILEPARMENRSLVPWDKNDVEYLKWMKVDLLSLGMLTAIRKCFHSIKQLHAKDFELSNVPAECPKVYASLARADTVGVFQIESRAQMNMLPRLLPRTFYDLVVEVAIVRPGPLQGGMVHPYLKRRQKLEPVHYDHPSLKPILEKTLGIPIFQEQVMKMAVAIAGFTPGEADQLRKVMSGAWRAKSHMHRLKEKLLQGMSERGISGEFSERVYKQIEGFGEYGFPESHAASFAILTYVSSYLKVHYPSEFACALLNSQPMGFYSPRELIHDAERHGVKVLPVNLFRSKWDCSLEWNSKNPQVPHLRMGLRLIRSFSKSEAEKIEALQNSGILSDERSEIPTLEELRIRFSFELRTLEKLVRAGALVNSAPLGDSRRHQLWNFTLLKQLKPAQEHFSLEDPMASKPLVLDKITAWESLLQDYLSTGISPKSLSFRSDFEHYHPAQFARSEFFPHPRWAKSSDLFQIPVKSQVRCIGLLTTKQKPPTAGGLVFVTLEDECGFFNLVLMPDVYQRVRLVLESGKILACEGRLEKSLNTHPSDPMAVALSIKATHLWNPFFAKSSAPQESAPNQNEELFVKSRSWH